MTNFYIKQSNQELRIGKIICLARTYRKHAQEMHSTVPKTPIVFLKPESSIIFSDQSIIIPKMSRCIHHEIELGVVIGKDGKNINTKNAMDHVLGYVVGLDITARDIQTEAKNQGWPWSIAKGFDTFAPISNVVPKENVPNPLNLDLILKVNGKIIQQSNTKYLLFSIEHILSYISQIMTLKAGDLILTGTPEGVGEIKEGDIIEAHLGSICSLRVNVKKER